MRWSIVKKLFLVLSGVTSGLSQGGKLSKRGPLATLRSWEMMVNPDVDVYSLLKPEIADKHSEKWKKTTYWKRKEYQLPKYKRSGGPVFIFSLPGGAVRAPAPRKLRHCLY